MAIMRLLLSLLISLLLVSSRTNNLVLASMDPTLYEFYTLGGITSGLKIDSDQFTLNGKQFVIYGGSFHYFRVAPDYWRPILQRYKAAGLNTIQLYVPWNLHEEIPGQFDFESPLLNLDLFLRLIKEENMFAIVRPGPFICAEWELGGKHFCDISFNSFFI